METRLEGDRGKSGRAEGRVEAWSRIVFGEGGCRVSGRGRGGSRSDRPSQEGGL